MKARVWPAPMRMVLDSPSTPTLAMAMLPLPVVRLEPAEYPIAMLELPVVLFQSAYWPLAVLELPVVLP